MKSLIGLALLLMSMTAFGQNACTTLYHNGDRDVILCHVGDTFTKMELTGSSATELPITEAMYRQMMSADAADLQAHTEQLQAAREQTAKDAAAFTAHHTAVMRALSITSKKQCTAEGFVWQHKACRAPEAK